MDFQEDSASDVLPGLLVIVSVPGLPHLYHSFGSRPSLFVQTGKAWN